MFPSPQQSRSSSICLSKQSGSGQLIASTCDRVSVCVCHDLSHGIFLCRSGLLPSLMQSHAGRMPRRWRDADTWPQTERCRFSFPPLLLQLARYLPEEGKGSWCCGAEGLQRVWDISHEHTEGRTWSAVGIYCLIAPLGRLWV